MKPLIIKQLQLSTILLIAAIFFNACVSTQVIANNHCDTFANNQHYQTPSWSYFWGLKKKDVYVGPDCDNCKYGLCREGSLNGVEVKTTFGGALLSMVTLGIVNYREVKWCCARPADGDGGLDQ